MELIDFEGFEPFNKLRKSMQTDKLARFDLFDPARHLTGLEREGLEEEGLKIKLIQLRGLDDKTLAYKNSRVFAYPQTEEFKTYHFAQCETLKRMRRSSPQTPTLISTRTDDWDQVKQASACPHCLQAIGFHGFDEYRNRKREYSEQVYADFSRQQFAKEFTIDSIS